METIVSTIFNGTLDKIRINANKNGRETKIVNLNEYMSVHWL